MAEAGLEWADWVVIAPLAAVASGALVILGVSMFFSGLPPETARRARRTPGLAARAPSLRRAGSGVEAELARMRANLLLALVATLALAVAGAAAGTRLLASPEPSTRFPMLQLDALAAISVLIVGLAAALVIWLSTSRLTSIRIPYGEYYCLILLGLAGGFAALQAENTMVLFLGLEVMAISASVLVAAERGKEHAIEAALKAFLANALASGMLLLGIAFLFGATGHFDYAGLQAALVPDQGLVLAGLALLFAGFAMKLGLVPFHQWLPDVQEGASTSIAAYVSTCMVMTVILAWLRFILHALPDLGPLLAPVFSLLGVASIAVANLMALIQRNVKRMLGWLVIAQAGTWVLTFVVGGSVAYGALLFYLIAYALVMLGAFGVVMTLKGGGRELERLEHFAGIAESRKGLAAIMTLFMLALAGVPGTVGFWARWHLVGALVGGGELVLALVAVLGSVVSLYICMQVPVMMYMRETLEEEASESSTNELVVLLLCAAVVIGLGIWPDPLISAHGVGLLELLQASVH
jgi:NADH-quinone oxidoreductase subunit N